MAFDFNGVTGFEWDRGNLTKNPDRHGITNDEAEEIFFRNPVVAEATRAGDREQRWFAIAPTERGRTLRVVFTVRGSHIRVISARVASKKERQNYEKTLRQN